MGILATGTIIKNRRGIPPSVKKLHDALSRSDVPRGTGYYIREPGSEIVYVCWKDNKCVTVLSSAHSGSADGTTKRRVKDTSGHSVVVDVPQPSVIKEYNRFMGGVDKSDQYISYHRVLRQTKKYWKTLFYHLIEIAVTNAFLLYQWSRMETGQPRSTESDFRDNLIKELVDMNDDDNDDTSSDNDSSASQNEVTPSSYTIVHDSRLFPKQRRCALCRAKTKRKCPDCPRKPPLCQTPSRDCHTYWHTYWHSRQCAGLRKKWFMRASRRQIHSGVRGRPKGRVNVKRRRGNYKSKT